MTDPPESTGFQGPRNVRVEDLIHLYDGIVDEVDAVLADAQIAGPCAVPDMPSGIEHLIIWDEQYNDPSPPEDLTDAIDGEQLGKLFSFFQNWTNYVQAETTRAQCVQSLQERHVKVVESALKLYYREKGHAVTLVKDYVNTDERFVRVDSALQRIKFVYRTMNSRYEQLKRTLNTISREQTRRGEELQRLIHDEHGGRTPDGVSDRMNEGTFRRRG